MSRANLSQNSLCLAFQKYAGHGYAKPDRVISGGALINLKAFISSVRPRTVTFALNLRSRWRITAHWWTPCSSSLPLSVVEYWNVMCKCEEGLEARDSERLEPCLGGKEVKI